MKNHKRFEELIQGYLDDTLLSEERKDLENHLKSCQVCREKLKSREELLQKLRIGSEEIQCPDYLIDNILKNTTQKETPIIISSSKIRWRYFAVSAAAVLIVISTVLFNINTEDSSLTLTPKKPKRTMAEVTLEKTEILEKTEVSSAKRVAAEIGAEKPHLKSGAKTLKAPKVPLLEKEEKFATGEEIKKAPLKATEPLGTIKMDVSQSKEIRSLASASKKETVSLEAAESDFAGRITSEENFKETRFVFPEEGAVVGKDFEIVLILENPEEKIEISIDGEKITNYIKEHDSHVIFIGSDSIPPLEEGLHYLSLKTKEEQNITFYKEG
jgi:hypothetical protein